MVVALLSYLFVVQFRQTNMENFGWGPRVAMIEAFYWLNSGIEGKIYSSSKKVMITVDSIGYPRLRPIRIRPVGRSRDALSHKHGLY